MRNPNEVMRAKCLQRKMGKNLARFSLFLFTCGPAQANECFVTKVKGHSISMRAVLLCSKSSGIGSGSDSTNAAEHTNAHLHTHTKWIDSPSTKNANNFGPMQCEISIALVRSPLNAAFGLSKRTHRYIQSKSFGAAAKRNAARFSDSLVHSYAKARQFGLNASPKFGAHVWSTHLAAPRPNS